MNKLRITVLVENTAGGRGLLGEHGLSLWIEYGERKVLFDTGQSRLLLANARRLGVDLAAADAIVLSHGHYDHTGGLAEVLANASGKALVHCHPDALLPKYRRQDATVKDIGMPARCREALQQRKRSVRTATIMVEVAPSIFLTGEIPRSQVEEAVDEGFRRDAAGREVDPFRDDQALFMDTPAGTVVFLGCAHAGVVNTLHHVRRLTSNRPLHMVLGGMHLGNASPERLERTVVELRRLDIPRLYPCHCTGFAAMARMWQEFPGRVAPCPTGTVIELSE